MKLLQELQHIIPNKYNSFNYLESNICSYYSEWNTDRNNEICMYYWFYSNDKKCKYEKRIVIKELRHLLQFCINKNILIINRKLFSAICQSTYDAGPCGYTVSIRMLEFLEVAKYQGRDGFALIDIDKILQLLTSK